MSLPDIDRPMGQDEARLVTENIRSTVRAAHELLLEAWHGRAWVALGYGSWDAYCRAEFAELRGELSTGERRAAVVEMTGQGMSVRAVASALSVPRSTVADDRTRQVSGNRTPEPDGEVVPLRPVATTGTDGKTYPATQPAKTFRVLSLHGRAFAAERTLDRALIQLTQVLRDGQYRSDPDEQEGVDRRLGPTARRALALLAEHYGSQAASEHGSVGGAR